MRTLVCFTLALLGLALLTDDASAFGRRKRERAACSAPAPCTTCGGAMAGGYAAAPCDCAGGYASMGHPRGYTSMYYGTYPTYGNSPAMYGNNGTYVYPAGSSVPYGAQPYRAGYFGGDYIPATGVPQPMPGAGVPGVRPDNARPGNNPGEKKSGNDNPDK